MNTALEALGMHYGCLNVDGFNPEALLDVVKDGQFEQRLLGAGGLSFRARAQRILFSGFNLDRGTYTLPVLAKGSFGGAMMGLALATHCEQPMWLNGVRVEEGQLMIFAEDRELAVRSVTPLWQWAVLRIPRSTLQAAVHARLGRDIALPQTGWQLCPRTVDRNARLRGQIHRAMHLAARWDASTAVEEGRLVGELLVDAFVDAMGRADGYPETASRFANRMKRERILQRAEALLQGSDVQEFSSSALSNALSLSERQLERIFRDIYGMTPKRWHQVARLNQARQMLLYGRGRCVTEIALRAGFSHLGRFARDYHALFGERPRDTHLAMSVK